MATSFETIYNRAVYRFSGYSFLSLTDEVRNISLEKYLFSAQSDFQSVCKTDLSERVDSYYETQTVNGVDTPVYVIGNYTNTLTDEEIEILSLGICRYWLSSKAINEDSLRNALTVKDYSLYSPANLLREVNTLRRDINYEYDTRIIEYSYTHGDISDAGN